MAVFTGIGAGTELDPYQITTVTQFKSMTSWGVVSWFKLMNDVDFVGLTGTAASFAIWAFNSHLDGGGYSVKNLTVGNTYMDGFSLTNGCSIKNIVFRVTNSVNDYEYHKERLLFGFYDSTLSNVSLTDIKVITSGSGSLSWFSNCIFNETCTLKNIVLEGAIDAVFTGTINGVIEGLKVLRTTPIRQIYYVSVPLVETLNGEMKFCQQIILNDIFSLSSNYGFLVKNLNNLAKITESFIYVDCSVNYPVLNTNICHGLIANSGAVYGSVSEVKDSYLKGFISVNGGEITNVSNPNNGKSGYAISPNINLKINRCIANIDIVSPLNTNRPIFTVATSANINSCFYNKESLKTLISVDVANRQNGLTAAQYSEAASFTTFDFANVWLMTGTGPELRNNPLYSYETPLMSCAAVSANRLSETAFTLVLSSKFVDQYGADIYHDNEFIATVNNSVSNVVSVPYADKLYTIKPFFFNGAVKTYNTEAKYLHYVFAAALQAPIIVDVINEISLTNPTPAQLVHGSVLYNGFIYGVTRNTPYAPQHGILVKTPVHNLGAYRNIQIKPADLPDTYFTGITNLIDRYTAYSNNMEQVVECGGNIYFLFYSSVVPGNALCKYDPIVDDYKIFRLPLEMQGGTAPIITDGIFLYWSCFERDKTIKINPVQFFGDFPKWNILEPFPVLVDAVYDQKTQGGYLAGGYSSGLKGECHSGISDAEYLYINYTTSRGTDSGYYAPLNISCHEVHKIRKSDMSAAGFAKIPKSTDDCSQSGTHIFYGIEVQPGADSRTFGYGWGAYAIRKSDLRLTGLPRLNFEDGNPSVTSYASLIFGSYLVDLKTNNTTYVLDISDVDNWSIDEPIGKRLLKTYKYQGITTGTATPNEMLLTDDGTFYVFKFSAPAILMELKFADIDFFAVPTVQTMVPNVTDSKVILNGFVLLAGGKPITEKGFKYGPAANNLLNTITSAEITPEFHAVLNGLAPGSYFYQAYAQNIYGESAAEIKTFSIASKYPVFYDGVRIKTVMYNNIEIKALNF